MDKHCCHSTRRAHYTFVWVLLIILAAVSAGCSNNNNIAENDTPNLKGHDPQAADKAPLFPVPVSGVSGTRWGYMDKSKDVVIAPSFTYAGPFHSNGWAQAFKKEELQLIDRAGRVWYASKDANMVGFFGDIVVVRAGSRSLILKQGTGKIVLDTSDELYAPKEGRIRFATATASGNRSYGFLDLNGKIVIKAQYMLAEDFQEGKAIVKRGEGDFALIGKNGELETEFAKGTAEVTGYSEGKVVFRQKEGGPVGYADAKGKVIVPPQYKGSEPFKNGLAVVSVGPEENLSYGIVNQRGKTVVPFKYNYLYRIGDGLFALGKVQKDNTEPVYTIADAEGHEAGTGYVSVSDDGNGHVYAYDGKQTYFINRSGRRDDALPAFDAAAALRLDGSFIASTVNDRMSLVRTDGGLLWKENRSVAITDSIKVKETVKRVSPTKIVYYPQLRGLADKSAEDQVNNALEKEALAALDTYNQIPDKAAAKEDLEWGGHAELTGDFEVSGIKNNLLVLQLNGYEYAEGAEHGMPWSSYMNVDLKLGRIYSLSDLIPGEKGLKYIENTVLKAMKSDKKNEYWLDKFAGIGPEQAFYIRGDMLIVHFNPYEVAPYAAGFPEFPIPLKDLEDWIDKDGPFWKSMQ